jgi:hypothetical protein
MLKARLSEGSDRGPPHVLLMTCCRHSRTEHLGSRRTPGLIAVYGRPCSRHGRHSGVRTRSRKLDRRCTCEEEAAKGRLHLQVRTLSRPIISHLRRSFRRFFGFGVPAQARQAGRHSPLPSLACCWVFLQIADADVAIEPHFTG